MQLSSTNSLRSCLKTKGLTRICTDETDLKTDRSKNNNEIQGSFTPFGMTDVNETVSPEFLNRFSPKSFFRSSLRRCRSDEVYQSVCQCAPPA